MFYLMEVLSTFVESFVAFYAVTQMSLPRVCERRKSLYLWTAAMGMTALVLFLNRVDSFSFLTIAVGFLCVIFGTHFTAKRNLICRTTATVISYLCIHGIDYVYIALFGLICNHETGFFHTFQEILSPGPLRFIFLLLSKGTDISDFCVKETHECCWKTGATVRMDCFGFRICSVCRDVGASHPSTKRGIYCYPICRPACLDTSGDLYPSCDMLVRNFHELQRGRTA